MSKFTLHELGVAQRLLVLTVLPLFIITTLLTTYMVVTRQQDREEVLADRGSGMVRYLAGAAEFGLFAGDNTVLKHLASTILKQEDVYAVRFFDPQGNLLMSSSEEPASENLLMIRQELVVSRQDFKWVFQIPVYYSELDVDQLETFDNRVTVEPLLGWVQLVMDERRMRIEQQIILITSLGLGILGFLGLFLLARYVAGGISGPVSALIHTVRKLEAGHLTERADVQVGGELGELAVGINNLAAAVEVSSQELNARVADATRMLTGTLETLEHRNKELEAIRENLLKASAAKGEFLARMSHELRTPLTAVSGYAKLLQAMTHSESQEEYLKSITGASAILLSTIDDILDFARLEAGVVTIEKLPFCLEEALEDVLAMHALTAHRKQLELVLLIEPDVPAQVIGDALRLRQIVTNLVSNALKFTDSGQVVLTVSLMSANDIGAELKFTVRDSGIGISEAHQAQLFNAFNQADQTIQRRFGGTGLGLAIAKELTRLMGGDINIYSQPGHGTAISFTTRCGIVEQVTQTSKHVQVRADNLTDRLYIYEKNPWARRSLRSVAMEMVANVSVNSRQQQLLANIRQSQALQDVVILGLAPDELQSDRLEDFLSKLRETFRGPIILLAGVDVGQTICIEDDCARFGPLYVRSKPLRKSKLLHVLRLAQSFRKGCRQPVVLELNKLQKSNRLKDSRILIAEDNDFNRNLICALIEAEGGVAIATRDGIEALRELYAQPIDLVLMDLNMPRLDGRLAVQELRLSDGAEGRVPVIALTAEILEGDNHDLLEQGFNRVLFKPLDEEFLIDSIAELLAVKGDETSGSRIRSTQSFLSALPSDILNQEILRQLGLLKMALREKDLKQVRDQAHQFRSVLYGIMESDDMMAHVRNLEQACDKGDLTLVEKTFGWLEEKLSQSLGC